MARLLVLLAVSCAIASAQISSATLVGTVTDSSGAAVSGAAVEARNLGTQTSRTAVTDANGEYVISELPAAHYSLTVKKTGFKTFNAPDIELQVAQRALINATLQVGAVEQELTVSAVAPLIDTTTSSLGQVIDTSVVEQMPLNGRTFWQLSALAPGATYNPCGAGAR